MDVVGYKCTLTGTIISSDVENEEKETEDNCPIYYEEEFSMAVTLKNLVDRMDFNKEMLKKHPEHKELLERKILETKELIVETVCNNVNSGILERIVVR